MPQSFYQQAKFLTSAAKYVQLPADAGMEIAFLGRSNSGKSSCLNALTHQKNLARVSRTPGRTQLINLFECQEDYRLVDLPGYGYAKVGGGTQKQWEREIDTYLQRRESLRGLVLIMDIRHPMQTFDDQILRWSVAAGVPVHILLNKADKLRFGAQKQTLLKVERTIKQLGGDISVQLFSATDYIGVDELIDQLDSWFAIS